MKPGLSSFRAALLVLLGAFSLAVAQPMTGIEVEADVEMGPLRGTLLLPHEAEGGAAVVIVPGSGPTDRDGNSPAGIGANYLRMLAEGLAADGVASIRIDKRGMFASAGSFPDPNAVTFGDYAADARAWIEVAREKAGTGCAWLVGHSEGGLVAMLAAQEAGPSLCGLVLVSAPGRRMGEVLREQFRSNPANAPLLPDALAAIDALEGGGKVDVSGFHPSLQMMFPAAVQDFLIDALSHDPAKLIAGLDLPILIVQGDNDLQVRLLDARTLWRAQPSSQLMIVPGMNHVLKTVPAGDVAANYAAYADPDAPLAEELVEAIAGFVKRGR